MRSTNIEITDINRARSDSTQTVGIRSKKTSTRIHSSVRRAEITLEEEAKRPRARWILDAFPDRMLRLEKTARNLNEGKSSRYTAHVKRTHAIS